MQIQKIRVDVVDTETVYKTSGYEAWKRATKEKHRSAQIHIFLSGEKLIDNLMNRRQRPYTMYRKELIPQILKEMKLPANTKVFWRQNAGCSCGCSPGFIVDGAYGMTAYVHVIE